MPTLTDAQKTRLIQTEASTSVNKIVEYLQRFDNLSLADFPLMSPERRKSIEEQLRTMPNAGERREWEEIQRMLGGPVTRDLLDKINGYIRHWEGSRPSGNHVDEAWSHVSAIQEQLDREQAIAEANDWSEVDIFSRDSMMNHLAKYPHSVHKNEIDDSIWDSVNREQIEDLQYYLKTFPSGAHAAEANNLLSSIVDWESIKNSDDVFIINDYITRNPNTPFLPQAQILITRLKQKEINDMKKAPNQYESDRLLRLVKDNIATENDLIRAGVITHNVFETLRSTNIENDLPDMAQAIASSTPECKEGFTDVYFFGIPSTGKTCVLMGLTRSRSLQINLASGGGDYVVALQQYTDVGVAVPRTPGNFVTTLESSIREKEAKEVHRVNLVEMAGEDFATNIVNNPNHIYTFEDMGKGATQLMKNDNHKVFFLIIDPTVDKLRFTHEVSDGFDEETGLPLSRIENLLVNQRALMQKLVNLFQDPSNSEIMKKVDAIHIIMTKADLLGDNIEREEKAKQIFYEKYADDILDPLYQLCKEYNINTNTHYYPKLYTYSLGTFYVGGYYEYDPTDSDRLVKAIKNSTRRTCDRTWWDKLKEKVN